MSTQRLLPASWHILRSSAVPSPPSSTPCSSASSTGASAARRTRCYVCWRWLLFPWEIRPPADLPSPAPLKELSATSLLAAYTQRVQLLPMVAAAMRSRFSAEQTEALEVQLMNAYAHWLDVRHAEAHEWGRAGGRTGTPVPEACSFPGCRPIADPLWVLSFNRGYAPHLAHLVLQRSGRESGTRLRKMLAEGSLYTTILRRFWEMRSISRGATRTTNISRGSFAQAY